MDRLRAAVLPLLGVALLLAGRADGFDWEPFEKSDVILVMTHDDDGDLRETKVWVVVVDGSGYVRTNASTWLENIQRDPQIELRAWGQNYLMRAEEVTDEALKEKIEEAFKEKYGFLQRTMSLFRFREPTVLRLVPRTQPAS